MVGGAVITFGLKDVASRNCYIAEPWDTSLHTSWSMVDGPPMHKEKLKPIVLCPVSGKFYVLDRTLASCDLEEFDPETKTWNPLPLPPIDLEDDCDELDDCEVLSHAILGDTIIFSTRKGIYAVHVILRYWKHLSSFGGEDEFPFPERSVFLDGFWYGFPCTFQSPVSAYDFNWDEGF